MRSISVVIVCKNEAEIISQALESVSILTDDIVVFDNGSTDGTQAIAKNHRAIVYEGSWEGFGKTKRKAVALARHDWILHLDADEAIDDRLRMRLESLSLEDESIVYEMRFKNFLGEKYLKFGEWGRDKHVRLFNRKQVNWNEAVVHEGLVLHKNIKIQLLPGYILHRTVKNVIDYARKMHKYALLNAEGYHQRGKQSSWIKLYLSPSFTFLKNYIFRLGFLDGREGFICATMTAYYTFLKYTRLKELKQKKAAG